MPTAASMTQYSWRPLPSGSDSTQTTMNSPGSNLQRRWIASDQILVVQVPVAEVPADDRVAEISASRRS